MINTIRHISIVLALWAGAMLGGCATRSEPVTLYDLGLLRVPQEAGAPPALPAVSVAEVTAPAWLDSPMMFYRLAYANGQQPRPYAASRWSMPPAQLFVQRLKSRMGQTGSVVLSASDGAANIPLLRVEADDFIQIFNSAGQSAGHIVVRVSVMNGRTLIAHKTFTKQSPAPSADAPGGVKALADASDAVIADMMQWLAGLPLKK
jgi:cholesterol transport system auxiliary component